MPVSPSVVWNPYEDDFLPGVESYVTLQTADELLSASLHGEDWGNTPLTITDAPDDPYFNDPFSPPAEFVATVRAKRAALRDASQIITGLPLAGRKAPGGLPLAFPRTGLRDADGCAVSATTIPAAVQCATAYLAAHLLKSRRDGSAEAERFMSNRVGQSEAVFRTPSLDNLPRHVRALLNPFLHGGATWAPVRA